MENYYSNYVQRLRTALESVEFTNSENVNLGPIEGLAYWQDLTIGAQKNGNSIYFVGNGASATMSSHMSADACKNGALKTRCLNDIALVTAISNDINYKSVFSLQLKRYAHPGDVLVTISSSGNSSNILDSIDVARSLNMKIVTLSGMKPNNNSRTKGDLNVFIPANHYGIVESGHQAILHCWLDNYLYSIGVEM